MTIPQYLYPRVLPVGETAFTVEFGDRVDSLLNAQVHTMDAYLRDQTIEGVSEVVPTYRSLLVIYNPNQIDPVDLQVKLRICADEITKGHTRQPDIAMRQIVEIPVRYGGDWGPDLSDVAVHTHLDPGTVVKKHSEPIYQVAMLGFAPGFTYLLGLPPDLSTPRLATPRVHVPPGSVGIAGDQTGLYALDTPGGWRIIGRTTLRLFDPQQEKPFILAAGDFIKFIAVE